MKKLKIVTIVGTRPEIIRLSCVMKKLDESCDHVIVHTGQNYDYELNQIFFDDLGLRKPNHFLSAAGATASETIGNVIITVDKVLEIEKPDALLVLGDTNSCLSVIPAKRRKIPIFHMEAGNRCFDQRVPEEINRKIVDHTADINLPYSTIARDFLIKEGFPADRIIKTGSPMFEVIHSNMESIKKSKVLSTLGLTKDKYFIVSAHREENIESKKNFENLIGTLNGLATEYGLPVVLSTHPRTRKKIESSGVKFNELVKPLPPFGFFDYIKLQTEAKAVLSDSGTINEESSILNFPALNIRETHERHEAHEEATTILSGLNYTRVSQCLKIIEKQKDQQLTQLVADYSKPNVAEKVVRTIHSYVDYVNKVVWKNY